MIDDRLSGKVSMKQYYGIGRSDVKYSRKIKSDKRLYDSYFYIPKGNSKKGKFWSC